MRSRFVAILFLLVLPGVPGCGEVDASLAPVKGRILCNSRPVAAAQVTFSPVPRSEKDREPGKPGTGFTDADGFFVLSTHQELDGAQIGQHNVSVALDEDNPADCKRQMHTRLEVKSGPNDFSIELNQ